MFICKAAELLIYLLQIGDVSVELFSISHIKIDIIEVGYNHFSPRPEVVEAHLPAELFPEDVVKFKYQGFRICRHEVSE